MAKLLGKSAFTIGLLVLLMSVPAYGASINKSIKIADGEERGGATSVNGSITVGSDAVVTGGLKTVNGSIRVDSGSEIKSAKTVNGSVKMASDVRTGDLSTVNGAVAIGENTAVKGDVSTVNGSIMLEEKSTVSSDVYNVNGKISIRGAEIGGDVKTVMGDVDLVQAVLKGDLLVEEPTMWKRGSKKRKPRVVIGPGTRVEGTVVIEHEVELFISDSAEVNHVKGVMSMDDAERFSGDQP